MQPAPRCPGWFCRHRTLIAENPPERAVLTNGLPPGFAEQSHSGTREQADPGQLTTERAEQ